MRYHSFLRNTMYLRYIIFFVTLFFAIYGVRAYLNRETMMSSIQWINTESALIKTETEYIKNFKRPFLESDWASYYIGHENWILYAWERVVRLRTKKIVEEDALPDDILARQWAEDEIKISSPEESRHFFINDKLTPLKDIWILK